jgi:hypothetical protein
MKIKLSKSQWEAVGQKAGWIKKAELWADKGVDNGSLPEGEVPATAQEIHPVPQDIKKYDRMNLATALYWYCADYHGGQNSPEYSVLSTLGYRPGAMERGIEEEDYEQKDVYDRLVSKEIDVESLKDFITGLYED